MARTSLRSLVDVRVIRWTFQAQQVMKVVISLHFVSPGHLKCFNEGFFVYEFCYQKNVSAFDLLAIVSIAGICSS